MKLYFLRHGIAGDPETWQGNDFERPLTPAGRDKMGREAKTIAKLDLGLDLIITSPLVRAKQTAEIVADRLKMDDKLVEDDRLEPGFDTARLASILNDHGRCDAIMLVGHEPDFSEVIGRLVGAARIDLKKAGLACVDLPTVSSLEGTLVWLIPPKILAL